MSSWNLIRKSGIVFSALLLATLTTSCTDYLRGSKSSGTEGVKPEGAKKKEEKKEVIPGEAASGGDGHTMETPSRDSTTEGDNGGKTKDIPEGDDGDERRKRDIPEGDDGTEIPRVPDNEGDDGDDTPLVLDMNRDGKIAPALHNDQVVRVAFDLRADGSKQFIEWISADDAFLAIDLDRNGQIDGGAELFGDASPLPGSKAKARHGFQALAAYDADHNGTIDARDAVFHQLLVWHDRNSDGISQPAELRRLDTTDIASISVAYENRLARGETLGQGSTTVAGLVGSYRTLQGQSYALVDVFFRIDGETPKAPLLSAK